MTEAKTIPVPLIDHAEEPFGDRESRKLPSDKETVTP
jgi:hypothetical protein